MKRLISFLLFFILFLSFSSADTIINDINYFSKLFPRGEGSLNEKDTLTEIKNRLDELGIQNNRIDFNETEGYHSYSSCIEADIEGAIKDQLITLIPVNGSSYGIASALSMAKRFKDEKPGLTLKFVFLGAEDNIDNLLGSRNFIDHFYPEEPISFLYLNFKTSPSSFKIINGSDGYNTPFNLFDATASALTEASIEYTYSNTETILFRLSAAGTVSRIKDYLAAGYPAIEITDGKADSGDSEVISEAAMFTFYNHLINEFSKGIPEEWDSNYIFRISEQSYLIIYLSILTLLMIYPVFKRRHFGWYMHTLYKNFWVIPILYLIVFGFFSLTSFALTTLFRKIDFPELWKYKPVEVFTLKISLALLMYSLVFKLLYRLPFSKRGSFYSISSIVLLVFVLFVFSAVNFSISIVALWSLLFIFLFTIFRKPALKFLMLLFSISWLVFSLYEAFKLPSFSVIKLITLSPIQGDLLAALILLPFILASIRLDMLSPPSKKITRFLPVALAVSSAGLLFAVLYFSPFNSENPQPVHIEEIVDDDSKTRELIFESPAGLGEDTIADISDQIIAPPKESEEISIDVEIKSFLNRKIIDFSLNFIEKPMIVRLSLSSKDSITLFESNFPAEWLPSKKELAVYVGRNPDIPLQVSLTLNKDAPINIDVEAENIYSGRIIDVNGSSYLLNQSRTIFKEYSHE